MTGNSKEMHDTKRLMGALVRMKPKPHEEMKLKPKAKKAKSSARKRASSKAKVARFVVEKGGLGA